MGGNLPAPEIYGDTGTPKGIDVPVRSPKISSMALGVSSTPATTEGETWESPLKTSD